MDRSRSPLRLRERSAQQSTQYTVSMPRMLSDLESPSEQLALLMLLALCLSGMGPVYSAAYSMLAETILVLVSIAICGDCVCYLMERRANEARDREDAIDAELVAEDKRKAETLTRYLGTYANKTLVIHEHCDSCNTSSLSGYEWKPFACSCPRADDSPQRREPCTCRSEYIFFSDACDDLAWRTRAPCRKCLVCGSRTDPHGRISAGRLEPPDPSAWLAEAHAYSGRTRYYEPVVNY